MRHLIFCKYQQTGSLATAVENKLGEFQGPVNKGEDILTLEITSSSSFKQEENEKTELGLKESI